MLIHFVIYKLLIMKKSNFKVKIEIVLIQLFLGFLIICGCDNNSAFEKSIKDVDRKILPRTSLVIEDYWKGTFDKDENITIDTQSAYSFPETIDYYIYIDDGEFWSFVVTSTDSVIILAYSDNVTENIESEDEYTYTIGIDGQDPVTIETNRATNLFGAFGSYGYNLEFHDGPTNLGYLVGGTGTGIPWKDIWCLYICCEACKKNT